MNTKIKNLIFILILGSISTSSLIGMRNYTLPKIERYHELKLKETILEAAGVEYEKLNLEDKFDRVMRKVEKDGLTYYISPDKLYVFIFEGRGLWGMITGAISLRADLKTIESLKIISQEETPGLGGRIAEQGFLDQFKKKEVSPRLSLVLRVKATNANEIDSITGASMTSEALIDMINESVINFRDIIAR